MSTPASATPWRAHVPNGVMRGRMVVSSSTGARALPLTISPSATTSSRSGASVKAWYPKRYERPTMPSSVLRPMSSSGAWITWSEAVRTGGSCGASSARACSARILIVASLAGLQHPVGAQAASGERAPQRQTSARLFFVGHRDLLEDRDGAGGVLVLDLHVHVIELERRARDTIMLFERLGRSPHVDGIDRLGREVAPAQRLHGRGSLQQEELVLLDDRRGQIVRGEERVARDAEALGQADEEIRVRRRLAAHHVLAALLHDERDEGSLALEIVEGRRIPADRDDLPGGVSERVEEEAALLTDHVAQLSWREPAVPEHPEQPVVQPGMGLLRLTEQGGGKFGGR